MDPLWRIPSNVLALPPTAVPPTPSGKEPIAELRNLVAETILDEAMSNGYGIDLPEHRRLNEPELRTAREIVTHGEILDADGHLAAATTPDRRVIGHCRHTSVLLAGILLTHGVPARVRTGFAAYLDGHTSPTNNWHAHWLVEHLTKDGWKRVDAVLDDVQQHQLGIRFNPASVPSDQFLTAAHAWQGLQAGDLNPHRFRAGIWSGLSTVLGVVVRDLAALAGLVPLPWDVWGCMPRPTHTPDEDVQDLIGDVATCTLDPEASAVRHLVGHPGLAMPDIVINGRTQQYVRTSLHP